MQLLRCIIAKTALRSNSPLTGAMYSVNAARTSEYGIIESLQKKSRLLLLLDNDGHWQELEEMEENNYPKYKSRVGLHSFVLFLD